MADLNDRITRARFLSSLGASALLALAGCGAPGEGTVKLPPSIKSKRKFSRDNNDLDAMEGTPKKGKR